MAQQTTDVIHNFEDLESLKRGLGARLRSLRTAQSLSGEELAARSSFSQPKVSRIENGRVTPSPSDVRELAEQIGLDEPAVNELVLEAEHIADVSRSHRRAQAVGGLAELQMSHRESESLYTRFRALSLAMVPGLLQTPQYAMAVMRMAVPDLSVADMRAGVARRVERQHILTDEQRTFDFTLGISAISNRYTSKSDHLTQLMHLRSMAEQPNIEIRLLQPDAGTPVPLQHDFTIYDSQRVAIELGHKEIFVADKSDIARYESMFEALVAGSLDRKSTYDSIEEAIDRLLNEAR